MRHGALAIYGNVPFSRLLLLCPALICLSCEPSNKHASFFIPFKGPKPPPVVALLLRL